MLVNQGFSRSSRKPFPVNADVLAFQLVSQHTFWADGLFSNKDVHRVLPHDRFAGSKSQHLKIHPAEQVLAFAQ
jgi:hypothetical protein